MTVITYIDSKFIITTGNGKLYSTKQTNIALTYFKQYCSMNASDAEKVISNIQRNKANVFYFSDVGNLIHSKLI